MKQTYVKSITTIFRRKKGFPYLKLVDIRSLVKCKHPEARTLKILEGELFTLKKVTDDVVSDLIYVIQHVESKSIAHTALDFLLKDNHLSVEKLSHFARVKCEVSIAEKAQEALLHRDISNDNLKYLAKHGARPHLAVKSFHLLMTRPNTQPKDLWYIISGKVTYVEVSMLAEDALLKHPSTLLKDTRLIELRQKRRAVNLKQKQRRALII